MSKTQDHQGSKQIEPYSGSTPATVWLVVAATTLVAIIVVIGTSALV